MEISLRAYQDKLDDLLEQDRYDELVAHARHILKTYPKNLRAYQQLGRALHAAGRWGEAAGVLRRLLGAAPSEFETHSLLAQCYRHIDQAERAIWHAERALDQKPSDNATTNLIRDLYREHRSEQIDRMQLTAGALAQQQIRNNLLHAALDTLAQALQRHPDRIDLKLLQARTLWLDGQRMDAAENAVDILDRLPYAIDANRIMAELWLAEQRPTDAQVYLRRIEELDPYLAHQLAAGAPADADLRTLDELDYSSITQREHSIVNPEWLNRLGDKSAEEAAGEDSGGLGALFGLDEDEAAANETDVTADLDDLLTDDQIETLFHELVTGETVAAVSAWQSDDEAALATRDEQGLLEGIDSPNSAERIDAQLSSEIGVLDENDDADDFAAQLTAVDDDEDERTTSDFGGGLDKDMARVLEELDSTDDQNDWLAEIQAGSLDGNTDDGALEYVEEFDREWVEDQADDAAGAPWLSAAMREAIGQDEDGDFDLFSDDEQLQTLLNRTGDTEPIHQADMDDWLSVADQSSGDGQREQLADIDDEELLSPPGASWLDDGDADQAPSIFDTESDDDPNQLNADLIDSWGAELEDDTDDDDDDPYVDWLSDDPNELGDDLSALAAEVDAETALPGAGNASDMARALGVDDPDLLAELVENAGRADEGAPDWMNAVVPGLDRENDAASDDPDEYARPMSAPGKEFAWVSNIVEEETGQMAAVDPAVEIDAPFFRFSDPPAWYSVLQAESGGAVVAAAAALSVDEDLGALELDDLTFDDYFNFDTPTDKMDVINLEDDTQQLDFVGIDWDDYFDLESPTEKTIAITLDESAAVAFDELGLDDDDFDFETPASKRPAGMTDADSDPFSFDDGSPADAGHGLDARDEADNDGPAWLNFRELGDNLESDDRDRSGGNSTV